LRLGELARRQLRLRSVGRALRLTDKFVGDTAMPRLPPTPPLLRLGGNPEKGSCRNIGRWAHRLLAADSDPSRDHDQTAAQLIGLRVS